MKNINTEYQTYMTNLFPIFVKQDFIDVQMSEKIRNHIKQKTCKLNFDDELTDNAAFDNLFSLYNNLIACNEINYPHQFHFYKNILADNILTEFSIKANNYIALALGNESSYMSNYWRTTSKYLIYIFSNTILVFLSPIDKPCEFLCALLPTAMSISFSTRIINKQVIVMDTAREPIEYFKKFNPCPDSKILSLHWEVTNSDGSRSFRGGLKPENNPLNIQLEYGEITIELCGLIKELSFSNLDIAKKFTEKYSNYLSLQSSFSVDVSQQIEIFNFASDLVQKANKPKKNLFKKYKALSPVWKCLIPLLIICGGIMVFSFIIYLIALLIVL